MTMTLALALAGCGAVETLFVALLLDVAPEHVMALARAGDALIMSSGPRWGTLLTAQLPALPQRVRTCAP